MMQYIKFNIVFFLFFSATIGAQEINPSLTNNSTDDLNDAVEDLVNKAKDENKLEEFKRLKKVISVPFNSTPLFLQTLESLKLAEERKNEIFSRYLPRVTSSVGGGVKSGGLNNDSNSQSLSLNVTQLSL